MAEKSGEILEENIDLLVKIANDERVPGDARANAVFRAYVFLPLVKGKEIPVPLGIILDAIKHYASQRDTYSASLIAERAGIIREAIGVYDSTGQFEEAEVLAKKYGFESMANHLKSKIPKKPENLSLSEFITTYSKD